MFVRLFQKLALRARSGIAILLTLQSQGEQIILSAVLLFQFVTFPICGMELLFVLVASIASISVREAGDFLLLLFIGPNVGSGCQTEAK